MGVKWKRAGAEFWFDGCLTQTFLSRLAAATATIVLGWSRLKEKYPEVEAFALNLSWAQGFYT